MPAVPGPLRDAGPRRDGASVSDLRYRSAAEAPFRPGAARLVRKAGSGALWGSNRARRMLRRRVRPRVTGLIERLVRHVGNRPPRIESDPRLIEAAVALVLAPGPDAILLIRRAERLEDPWSGQMGLPGGRRGPADLDLQATAVRETREEVGLDLSNGRLVGALDDLAPSTPVLPPIKVRPYVFVLEERQVPIPNGEVAAASWVPLADFIAPGAYGEYEVEARGLRFARPAYRLTSGLVWGMTERILTPVLGVLSE